MQVIIRSIITNVFCVSRSLITDCLVGTGKENNPTRHLKLAMICSHPDSTLAILKASGFIQEGSSSSDSDLTRPEGIGEGEEIPLDKDPRLAKSLTFHPEGGERLTGAWGLSDEGLDAYFKVCYLVMLTKYQAAECLDDGSYQFLVQWVESDGFLDAAGEEYNAALNALKALL